ncbi:hypothetical protein HK405_010455, partial [Cladochytrium tenue]
MGLTAHEQEQWFNDFLAHYSDLVETRPLRDIADLLLTLTHNASACDALSTELAQVRVEQERLKAEIKDRDEKIQKAKGRIHQAENRALFVSTVKDDLDAAISHAISGWPRTIPDYDYDIYISYSSATEAALAEVFFLYLQLYPNLNPRENALETGKHQNKGTRQISQLRFANNYDIEDAGVEAIANFLWAQASTCPLKTLTLDMVGMYNHGFVSISRAAARTGLEEFNVVSNNELDGTAVRSISEEIMRSQMKRLGIFNSSLGSNAIAIIARALKANTFMTSLNLW